MKKLKIRFVQRGKNAADYYIQRRRFLIWWTITYTINMGYGSVVSAYQASTQEELLDNVLNDKYNTCKEFVRITEYPTIKQY